MVKVAQFYMDFMRNCDELHIELCGFFIKSLYSKAGFKRQ